MATTHTPQSEASQPASINEVRSNPGSGTSTQKRKRGPSKQTGTRHRVMQTVCFSLFFQFLLISLSMVS